jgi:hypothetical protein
MCTLGLLLLHHEADISRVRCISSSSSGALQAAFSSQNQEIMFTSTAISNHREDAKPQAQKFFVHASHAIIGDNHKLFGFCKSSAKCTPPVRAPKQSPA